MRNIHTKKKNVLSQHHRESDYNVQDGR
jgi:hypothetical protein